MSKKFYVTTFITIIFIFFLMGKIYYDTNTIEVQQYKIKNNTTGKALSGLKVAHLSDLHIRKSTIRENKILAILDQEKPDLIFLTGDYIKGDGSYGPVRSFLSQLKAPWGVFAVMGNTEYYNENGSCVLCHKEGTRQLKENPNPIFLRNSQAALKIKGKELTLLGVDDPVNQRANLRQAFQNKPYPVSSILLAHSPEIFPDASDLGIDLVLTGHTHGGQIWGIQYLNKVFPLEPALEFLNGFFQKGKTLMYVNRGIGTSFLPFRLGVKPEITFFNFWSSDSSPDQLDHFRVSNSSTQTVFTGLTLGSFLETFNFFSALKRRLVPKRVVDNSGILFDFESLEELTRLNWECHKWFELSREHVTSGKFSLKASFPPGQYPGIDFEGIQPDWSPYGSLTMDVFNPYKERLGVHIRIDDHKSEWEYANRFDLDLALQPGPNTISIPINSIKTNLHHRPLNLAKIERLIFFVPNKLKPIDLYLDNIRLN